MSKSDERNCVVLPVGDGRRWAVPPSCLAEIVTLHGEDEQPPQRISWRGVDLPVLDPGSDGGAPWRDPRTGAALVAVLLGVGGMGCDYWALSLRGGGLTALRVAAENCEDQPEADAEHALAVFSLQGELYQVPDLPALQQRAAALQA